MGEFEDAGLDRRAFVRGVVSRALIAAAPLGRAASKPSAEQKAVIARSAAMHDDNVQRLQEWIALPSIAAEIRNYPRGAEYMAELAAYQRVGATPQVLPRSPGSWPGYRFTGAPLNLPARGFGMGHGTGAHALALA